MEPETGRHKPRSETGKACSEAGEQGTDDYDCKCCEIERRAEHPTWLAEPLPSLKRLPFGYVSMSQCLDYC